MHATGLLLTRTVTHKYNFRCDFCEWKADWIILTMRLPQQQVLNTVASSNCRRGHLKTHEQGMSRILELLSVAHARSPPMGTQLKTSFC